MSQLTGSVQTCNNNTNTDSFINNENNSCMNKNQ